MKKTIFLLSILTVFAFNKMDAQSSGSLVKTSARKQLTNKTITDPVQKRVEARDYSKKGDGIGVFMNAGVEYDGFTDEKINELFNNSVAKYDVKVKVFISRTDKRKFSIFKAFVYGEGVGVKSNITDFSNYLKKAIDKFKNKTSMVSRKPRY